MFKECDLNNNGRLEDEEIDLLSNIIYKRFSRLGGILYIYVYVTYKLFY